MRLFFFCICFALNTTLDFTAQIDAILKKVGKIPSSKYKENLEGYKSLLRLDPTNEHFKSKVAYYKTKFEEFSRPKIYTNSIGMKFVLLPSGIFIMGSNNGDSDEKPPHEVRITRPFYLGQYEVTQGQWEDVIGSNPSKFKNCGKNCPVEKVSWNDVQDFIKKLNSLEGCANSQVIPDATNSSSSDLAGGSNLFDLKAGCYRLPTEAEWEYAARAGTTSRYYWGKGVESLSRYGNFCDENCAKSWAEKSQNDGYKHTAPVGSYKANSWNLHDMSGNVWEWAYDWKASYGSGTQTDPIGPRSGSGRVTRGGGWYFGARHCRSVDRVNVSPDYSYSYLGFRLLRTP